jgi:hypothetical protein
MSEQVLGRYLDEFAVIGLLLTFIYVMIIKAITTTGIINCMIAAYSTTQKRLIKPQVAATLKATAIIATITMGLIITKVFVLSGRYVVALAFVLMILAAFQLGQLLTQYSQNKIRNKQLVVAIHLILIFMLGSIIKNVWPKAEGYNYMQDAVAWVKANNPNNKPVFYNEQRLIFYSGEKFKEIRGENFKELDSIIHNNKLNEFDYLVIKVNNERKESEVLDKKISSFKKVFISTSNKSKKSVIIYERKKSDE